VDGQYKAVDEFNKINNTVATMETLANIRNSINSNDKFYDEEQEYFNEQGPVFNEVVNDFKKSLFESKFRPELEEKYGKYLFDKIEVSLKTFKPEIIEDQVQENKLVTKYSKLIASAKIEFQGEVYNLPQMSPFSQSLDRNIREQAQLAVSKFFGDNEAEFDSIYDELVKVRHQMAVKLGYENYIDLGYDRLGRTDYNSEMVKTYRDQVYKDIVPLSQNLISRQGRRLGISDLKYYDLSLKFLTGNAKPDGDKNYLVNAAKNMYEEMSKETGEFINFMLEHNLLDLEAKPGKHSGGYCTFITDYKSPFIFANFNGTSGDVDVLTHEAGHAFQVYQSRNFEIADYMWPTYEACEIHSMSMEFFAWPWMKNFFGKDELKYKYSHLSEALIFIPYGVSVDEFQHFVYGNPNATPNERKAKWREIEKKYLPHKNYEGNDVLERGCYWFRQGHIFQAPFYYIDYTLAQVLAFQYFIKSRENYKEAWAGYVALCKLGGSKPFLELVEAAGLDNPFKEGSLTKAVNKIDDILDSFDDRSL
jgi:M3 family oligoendopeptidase